MKPSTNYEFAALMCLMLILGSIFEIGPFAALQDRSTLFVVAAVAAAASTILREMGR